METYPIEEEANQEVRERPSPLVVDSSFAEVRKLFGLGYKFQRMTIDMQIISDSMYIYSQAFSTLKDYNFKFFTCQEKDEKKVQNSRIRAPKTECQIYN